MIRYINSKTKTGKKKARQMGTLKTENKEEMIKREGKKQKTRRRPDKDLTATKTPTGEKNEQLKHKEEKRGASPADSVSAVPSLELSAGSCRTSAIQR